MSEARRIFYLLPGVIVELIVIAVAWAVVGGIDDTQRAKAAGVAVVATAGLAVSAVHSIQGLAFLTNTLARDVDRVHKGSQSENPAEESTSGDVRAGIHPSDGATQDERAAEKPDHEPEPAWILVFDCVWVFRFSMLGGTLLTLLCLSIARESIGHSGPGISFGHMLFTIFGVWSLFAAVRVVEMALRFFNPSRHSQLSDMDWLPHVVSLITVTAWLLLFCWMMVRDIAFSVRIINGREAYALILLPMSLLFALFEINLSPAMLQKMKTRGPGSRRFYLLRERVSRYLESDGISTSTDSGSMKIHNTEQIFGRPERSA